MLLKSVLESNVTPNISRSSDSVSTVLPIVNLGYWECSVRDPETNTTSNTNITNNTKNEYLSKYEDVHVLSS